LDNDILQIGSASGGDVSLTWDATNLLVEAAADNTGQIRVGSTNAIDLAYYGSTNTNIALFDVSAALLDLNGWGIRVQDGDSIAFGDGSDVTANWDASNLLIEAATQDTGQIRIGSTNAIDLVIYDNAATGTVTHDVSTSIIDLNGWDLRVQDDDAILFGDSAVNANSNPDALLKWDSTNTRLYIEGVSYFVDNVTMAGNLTLSGTLSMSGSLAPGSVALGDAENMIFGDDTDYTISTAGSTAALIITAANANDAVNIGDGSVATDFRLDNITTAGADFLWDQSADSAAGTLYLGTDGKGFDVFFYGDTAGDYIQFDMSADKLIVEDCTVVFMDDTELLFGDGTANGGDFKISCDGSKLQFEEVASAGKAVEFGVDNKGLDVKFFGETASSYLLWDQSGDQLLVEAASIALGDGDAILLGDALGTGDFTISSTSAVMTIGQVASGTGEIAMGADGKGIDQTWYAETASDYMKWDQDGNSNLGALIFEDSAIQFAGANSTYTLAISTDAWLITATDHANSKVTWGDNGTNGLDQEWLSVTAGNLLNWDAGAETLKFTDVLCTMTGADSRGTILAITGIDTTGDTDTVTIDHSGAGNGLFIDANEADSQCATLEPFTNSTVAALEIDGDSAGWLGASGVGMLHLRNDIAHAHANASMLLIDKSAAIAEVNSAEGTCLRIVEAMNVAGTPPAYAMYISSTNNEALHVDAGTVVVDETVQVDAGIKFNTTTTIFTVKVEVTNAQIKGLAASPKELVAAQGADTLIEFVGATFIHDYGSEVLTESADNMAIKYDDDSGTAVTGTIEATGFVDAAADTIMTVIPAAVPNATAAATVNKRLALDNTGDGEYGGNASNDTTWTIFVSYRVHTVGL
jgi:hypothetical protein